MLILFQAVIAVPNPLLSDNHQQDLVGELARKGHVFTCPVGSIATTIRVHNPLDIRPYDANDMDATSRRLEQAMFSGLKRVRRRGGEMARVDGRGGAWLVPRGLSILWRRSLQSHDCNLLLQGSNVPTLDTSGMPNIAREILIAVILSVTIGISWVWVYTTYIAGESVWSNYGDETDSCTPTRPPHLGTSFAAPAGGEEAQNHASEL